ncbi:hypothetical protein AX777_23430 [Sphingobium yanoikuyae]|uniref:Tetratricopeptide repeat protein n=1 Tax=Sphingobium yanoikuyae TaxID=13690 RepID=A0A177JCU1_SPHYA|nr:hypothetical protein AX777_23430 [Sphingobium yanoikuyae]
MSDGSESELIRVTSDLERLHVLMSRLYGTAGQTETSPKLEVTLYDSRDDIKRLGLRNLRSEEGPFAKDFAGQRYYDPRTDGDVIAIARSDQIVHLDTSISHDRFCEGLAQNGVDCIGKKEPYLPSVVRSWQSILYSAFAQHFILTNAPRPYPRWYLDGIGALFSSMEVQGDGSLDYAKPPVGYRQIFYAYGDVNGRDILTGSYLSAPSRRMVWTPYHAWLITHFFVFSDLKPELGAQFRQYMAAIGRGASPEKAALVFRDMTRLSRQIGGYAERGKSFSTAKPLEEASQPSPLVTMLSLAEVAVLDANLKLSDLPPILALSEESIGNAPTQWVDQARNEVIQLPFNAAAMLVIVEAECRNARLRECLTDAERVLAQSPENARALAWKGVALAEQALHSPQGQRANALAVARETIDRALQLDPNDPVAAIAYFQSFTKVGEPVPEPAMVSLAKIATSVPAAPRPRLLLGKELLRQGNTELAQKLLWPVIYGAYDSPESEIAKRLLAISANSN